MKKVKSLITGVGVTAGQIYNAMDFILEDNSTVTAVIQDGDGYRHFLSESNYERLN